MKKIISVILSIAMVFTVGSVAFAVNTFAADDSETAVSAQSESYIDEDFKEAVVEKFQSDIKNYTVGLSSLHFPSSMEDLGSMLTKILYRIADVIIDCLVGAINFVVPSVKFESKDDYNSEQFYTGSTDFLSEAAAGAVWNLGYASASLQTGDELDGKHYVGGSLSFPKSKAATEIHDDQRVRCIALNDGSGRGTAVFAVIDGFGFSNADVEKVRVQLADFAKANNIVSINVSVLHQHSCVDTFGMNGDLIKMLFANPTANIMNNALGLNVELLNGQNKSFMDNLFKVTTQSVKDAVNSMTNGKMYYSEIDATEFIRDKREPKVYDTDIHRLRFVPDNGARETWLCNMAIHCVGNGAAGTAVTGDYPYYMEQVINEKADANFIEIQGAELAITSQYDALDTEDMTRLESLQVYGKALGDLVVDSTASETEVEPLLNVRHTEYFIPVSNKILEFAGRMGALTNKVVKTGVSIEVATEMGYMEFGDDLAIAIIPGELEPAIAYGGYLDSTNSWTGTDFDYPCFKDIVKDSGRELLIFGLTNDQVGYILEDNDYSSILSGVNEEIVATGNHAGSTTIETFEKLYASVK